MLLVLRCLECMAGFEETFPDSGKYGKVDVGELCIQFRAIGPLAFTMDHVVVELFKFSPPTITNLSVYSLPKSESIRLNNSIL